MPATGEEVDAKMRVRMVPVTSLPYRKARYQAQHGDGKADVPSKVMSAFCPDERGAGEGKGV